MWGEPSETGAVGRLPKCGLGHLCGGGGVATAGRIGDGVYGVAGSARGRPDARAAGGCTCKLVATARARIQLDSSTYLGACPMRFGAPRTHTTSSLLLVPKSTSSPAQIQGH
jgi:hypothetical protein